MATVAVGLRFTLAFVFLGAALPKLAAADDFAVAVANYRLVPDRWTRSAARIVPRVELIVGTALLLGVEPSGVALAAALLLGVFAVAVAINLARGRVIECGCAGAASPRRITWGLVAKDIFLAACAIGVFFEGATALSLLQFWGPEVRHVATGSAIASLLVAGTAVLVYSLASQTMRLRRAIDELDRARTAGGGSLR